MNCVVIINSIIIVMYTDLVSMLVPSLLTCPKCGRKPDTTESTNESTQMDGDFVASVARYQL